MKEYRKIWLKLINTLLGGVLILLGFSSCEDVVHPDEYGTPHARYELKGKVIDPQRETVTGIQVVVQEIVKEGPNYYKHSLPTTLYTNQEGSFIYKDDYAWPYAKLRVIYKDINKTGITGIYKTDSIDVDMGELSGKKSSWYMGEASKEITIQLVEKTANDK